MYTLVIFGVGIFKYAVRCVSIKFWCGLGCLGQPLNVNHYEVKLIKTILFNLLSFESIHAFICGTIIFI